MKSIARATLVLFILCVPTLALASTAGTLGVTGGGTTFVFSWGGGAGTCASSLCGIASTIVNLINNVLVPLLFAIAFIVFLYGIASTYIFSRGDSEEVKKGHTLILWGLIGFAVMISLWGLVNVVASTFGLGGYTAPALPKSY